MRCPASEKLEIIQLVEGSHLSTRVTLAKLGIPRTTFYRWYNRYRQRGEAGLQDQSPKPKHVWNRLPDEVKRKVVDFALKETELSPSELAVTFTDQERYVVSESTVYRVLKAHDLITSPAFIVIKAANEFKDKTTAINQLWQREFIYIKVLGWGWFYLSTVLDDYSRYIVSWKAAGELKSVHDALLAHLKTFRKLFIDETPTPVFDPGRGKTKKWYFWALARDELNLVQYYIALARLTAPFASWLGTPILLGIKPKGH
jgi:transposase-like protein